MNYSDKRYVWYLAGAEEFNDIPWYHGAGDYYVLAAFDPSSGNNAYNYQTDGAAYGHQEGCGNGWGYNFATVTGHCIGYGEEYYEY